MDIGETLLSTLNYTSSILQSFGIFAWALLIISILFKHSNKNLNKMLSPVLIKALKLLAHRGIICLVFVSAVYLPWRHFLPNELHYINEIKIIFYSILIGTGLRFIMGHQGFGIPLGDGLMMTVDKAPSLAFEISNYVISFHVDKNFTKKRRTVTNQIITTINTITKFNAQYDFILKSWVFSDRDCVDATSIYYIRSHMHRLRRTLKACGLIIVLFAAPAFYTYYIESFNSAKALIELVIATIGIAALLTVYILYLTKRRMRAVCSTLNSALPSSATQILARELVKKTIHYNNELITPQPMPAFHILSFSILETAIIKDCVGIETGFGLIRHKNIAT